MNTAFERKGTYKIDDVLVHVRGNTNVHDKKKLLMDFDGDLVKIRSERLLVFKRKGTRCVKCGVEGKYFAKERKPGASYWHMNLYAVDEQGHEVMMTKDHIVPKAKGGASALYNYQPMCVVCNGKKADTMPKHFPKKREVKTREQLQKEIDRLQSILGGKDANISQLIKEKEVLAKESGQLKAQVLILKKSIRQLGDMLAES